VSLVAALVVEPVVDPAELWAAGFLAALAWAVLASRRRRLDARATFWAALAGGVLGLWGGHLVGLLDYGADGPWTWARFWTGGKSWHGGLVGGAAGALLALRLLRQPVLRHADVLAGALPLGYAIGRVGCFMHGDDYGAPATLPWSVRYHPDTEAFWGQLRDGLVSPADPLTVPVHPVQLYHALFGILLLVALGQVPTEPPGRRLGLLLVLYGAGRFALEWLRGERRPALGPLTLHQGVALGLVTAGSALLLAIARRRKANAAAAAPGAAAAS